MQKALRRLLEPDIFDIVLYGSAAKGAPAPRDIDVLVLFTQGTLRERLVRIQSMKESLKSGAVDIKQALIGDMFSSSFLARTGVILEGTSVRSDKPFSERLGFRGYSLFWWRLAGLSHAQKVKFGYLLAGRGMRGVLDEMDAERLVSGIVKVPIRNSLAFEEILKKNAITYRKKNILEEI